MNDFTDHYFTLEKASWFFTSVTVDFHSLTKCLLVRVWPLSTFHLPFVYEHKFWFSFRSFKNIFMWLYSVHIVSQGKPMKFRHAHIHTGHSRHTNTMRNKKKKINKHTFTYRKCDWIPRKKNRRRCRIFQIPFIPFSIQTVWMNNAHCTIKISCSRIISRAAYTFFVPYRLAENVRELCSYTWIHWLCSIRLYRTASHANLFTSFHGAAYDSCDT